MTAAVEQRVEELLGASQRGLEGLFVPLQVKAARVVKTAAAEGLYFGVFQGKRSWEHQAALYAQGREPVALVNVLRAKAALPPISEAENRKKVTKAPPGYSWHNFALAVDLVEDGDPNKAGIQWSWENTVNYVALGRVVKRMGLNWGGSWKAFKDYPHAEHPTYGLTLADARTLYLHGGGVEEVWREVRRRAGSDL